MEKTEFGKLLTGLRQRDNMTQSDLAGALGVSVSAVSKWETGKNYPDIPVFADIKKLFHLSYDDLYHPEQTLKALEQGTLIAVENRVSSDLAVKTAVKKSRRIIFLLAVLLVLSVGFHILPAVRGNLSPNTAAESESPSFWVYSSDTAVDESLHQQVYEIILVAEDDVKITKELWEEEFYRFVDAWWKEHPEFSGNYVKVSAYQAIDDAKRQTDTDYTGYSYRNERLK